MNLKQIIRLGGMLLLLGFSGWAGAVVVRYVKAGASGANNGSSWANAYTDLQAALAAAEWGDEIWVAAGTYKPTSGTDRTKSFVMTAGVALYGGFTGTETARVKRDWTAHETILSGDIGTSGTATDNSFHVVVGGHNAALDGFTVRGGRAGNLGGGGICNFANRNSNLFIANCAFVNNVSEDDRYGGGGIYNANASLKMDNCTFIGNYSITRGGGIYIENAPTTVTYCRFIENSAYHGGGGVYNTNTTGTLSNCYFERNFSESTGGAGGGLTNVFGNPIISNCTFIGNSAHHNSGGGMYNYEAFTRVADCMFIGNSASGGGGGICNYDSSPMIINSTFNNNTAGRGGGIYNHYNQVLPSPTIMNCILWNNTASLGINICNQGSNPTIHHSDIGDSGGSGAQWDPSLGTDGGGNIMADPRFVNAANPAGADGLWRTDDDGLALQVDSPCINAGYATGAPADDILGHPRTGAPDIGAYEYQGIVPTPTPIPSIAAIWDLYE